MTYLIQFAPHFPHSCLGGAGQQTVRSVRHFLVAIAVLGLAAATATAALTTPKLIYKVDTVTVKASGSDLVVTATGAVNSGGWSLPHLRVRGTHAAESDTAIVDFLATPPPPNVVVIQALVPVSAMARFPLPRYGTVQVQVVAETNSVTAPVR
jgi:hypothetical protein